MKIQQAREQFLSYLEAERGYSPLTIQAYRSDLSQFIESLNEQGASLSVEEIQTGEIRNFVVSLQARGLKPATIARRINCLRSFFHFLWTNEYVPRNPCVKIRTPKQERKLPMVLSKGECRALLEAAYKSHYTMLGFRDRAIVSLLLYTGVRRAELLNLRLDDLDLKQGWVRVRREKGKKMRLVPLVPEAIAAIEDWLEFRPACQHQSLFTTLARKPLGRHGLQALFRKALRNASITRTGITIHTLRHSFATLLLRNGCDLMSIKEMLGYASLESTAIYLHVDMSSLQAAAAKHPLRASG